MNRIPADRDALHSLYKQRMKDIILHVLADMEEATRHEDSEIDLKTWISEWVENHLKKDPITEWRPHV